MRLRELHDNQFQTLCLNLKDKDIVFRELNKKIILNLIEDLMKPPKKDPRLVRDELELNFIYNLVTHGLSIFFPETIAKQQKLYDEWRNQPEQKRKRDLETAELILEKISHNQRIEYLENVLKEGLLKANNRWVTRVRSRKARARIIDAEFT
jgi:hypothetical protein